MGYDVDNYYFKSHWNGSAYDKYATRHRGDANPVIDATSAGGASSSQWEAIVTQAWTGGDVAFTAALATPWPTWTADHVTTPGLLDTVRAFVRLDAPQV